MAETTRRLKAVLEVVAEVDTITGVVTGEDGRARPFSGWMEFARVIEDWRAANDHERRLGSGAARSEGFEPPTF